MGEKGQVFYPNKTVNWCLYILKVRVQYLEQYVIYSVM